MSKRGAQGPAWEFRLWAVFAALLACSVVVCLTLPSRIEFVGIAWVAGHIVCVLWCLACGWIDAPEWRV